MNKFVSLFWQAAESFGQFRKFGQGFPGQGGLGDIDEGDDGQDDDIPGKSKSCVCVLPFN